MSSNENTMFMFNNPWTYSLAYYWQPVWSNFALLLLLNKRKTLFGVMWVFSSDPRSNKKWPLCYFKHETKKNTKFTHYFKLLLPRRYKSKALGAKFTQVMYKVCKCVQGMYRRCTKVVLYILIFRQCQSQRVSLESASYNIQSVL